MMLMGQLFACTGGGQGPAAAAGWAAALTAPLRLGGRELLPTLVKLGSALGVGSVRRCLIWPTFTYDPFACAAHRVCSAIPGSCMAVHSGDNRNQLVLGGDEQGLDGLRDLQLSRHALLLVEQVGTAAAGHGAAEPERAIRGRARSALPQRRAWRGSAPRCRAGASRLSSSCFGDKGPAL